jgi:hypothetical protein
MKLMCVNERPRFVVQFITSVKLETGRENGKYTSDYQLLSHYRQS